MPKILFGLLTWKKMATSCSPNPDSPNINIVRGFRPVTKKILTRFLAASEVLKTTTPFVVRPREVKYIEKRQFWF